MKPFYRLLLALGLLLQGPNIFAQVHAAFTSNTPNGCSPLVVAFTDQSTGSPTDWLWDFGNGNTSVQRNPSAAYLTPGQYTVRLLVRNASGADSIVKTNYVTVYFPPVAAFNTNDTVGCAPRGVVLNDQSTAGSSAITSWTWDFGDGNTSNAASPQHTYSNPGAYGVVLLVKDANGCTDRLTRANYVIINPQPAPSFTVANTTVCGAPHTVDFTNTTAGNGNTYTWDFGDGTNSTDASPQHLYTNSGNYTVKLTATSINGCVASVTKTNYINIVNFHTNFTVDHTVGCVGDSFHFADQSGAGTVGVWHWDLDAGNTSTLKNPTVAYSTPGNYSISLSSSILGGCSDSLTMTSYITVRPSPVASFTADTTTSCSLPFFINFNAQPPGMISYTWDFGNGGNATGQSLGVYYNTAGSFAVKLTVIDSTGCKNTLIKNNYIVTKPPRALFMAPIIKGCAPLDVNFRDQTPIADSIVTWKWIFGDGTTSTDPNPLHTYADTGYYTVQLVVTNAQGCVDTFKRDRYIKVGQPPIVAFDADPRSTCAITPIHFTDSTNVGDEWKWDFGDGGTGIVPNPIYHYSDTGLFTVTLIVGNNGCYDTLLKPAFIQIYPPIAKFTPVFTCADPYNVSFTNTSLGGNRYIWTFGDGDSSFTQSTTHVYSGSGSYNVSLWVMDTVSGCIDSTSSVIVLTHPVADFSDPVLSGCKPFTTTFTSTSTDALSYSWLFGDGSLPSSTQNPVHMYTASGLYTVRLTVTDANHCVSQMVKTNYITVHQAKAGFTATPLAGCAPLIVNYTDTSSSFMGHINSWNWKLGNNDSSTVQNPASQYMISGSYTVTLAITDDNGCTDTIRKVNYINPTQPKPAFTAATRSVCLGGSVSFTNQSNGIGLSHHWNFGDGDTLLATSPTHTYRDTGYYTVSLRLTDVNGCDSTLTKLNYIHVVQSHAKFVIDTNFAVCPPLTVHFTDQSYDSVTRWMYHFGDGQTSGLKNPAHIYTSPGVYHPWLIATNYLGCSDTTYLTDSIVVKGPTGTFTFLQPSVCIPFSVTFFATTSNNVSSLIWDYGDGSVSSGVDTTVHQYGRTGVFNPVLIIQDSVGCTQSIPAPRPINANTAHAVFIASPLTLCGSGNVTFNNQSTGVPALGSCRWDFGDGTISILRNPMHNYTSPGTYTVKLISTNSTGCYDTMIKPSYITVYAGPHASFTASDSAVCLHSDITFTDTSRADSAIATRSWNFGDGGTSLLQNPTHTFNTAGTFTVSLVITTINGCNDTTRKTVTIYSLPVVNAGNDRTICLGDTVHMMGSGGTTYKWSPSAGLSNDSINNPIANITATNTYALMVTDTHGCKANDSMSIRVNSLPTIATSADTAICPGMPAHISASGAATYQWSPATGLSAANIANPSANITATTTYAVMGTDTNGCKSSDSVKVTLYAPAIATATPDTSICIGSSVALHASGGASYSWSPATNLDHSNIANPITTPTATITYTVQATDTNGCKANDSVTVTLFAPAVATASNDTAVCRGSSAQLHASGGVSYRWTPATNLSADTIANPISTPGNTITYTVRVTDANGCKANDSVTVRVNALPTVTTSNDTSVCPNTPVRIWAAGGLSYQWSPANGLSSSATSNPIANVTSTATYTVLVTDSNGCKASDSVALTTYQAAVATASNDTAICIGQSAQLHAQGGTQYLWSPAAGLNNTTVANPTSTATATTQYVVEVTTADGCKAKDSLLLTINQLPIINASHDTAICVGNMVQLSANGGTSYQWTPANGLSNSFISNPVSGTDSTITYVVSVTDANGCKAKDTVKITVNPLPVVSAFSDPSICKGDTLRIHATGGTTYNWTPATALDNAQSANPLFTSDINRTYSVKVTDVNGCSAFDSVSIIVKDIPRIRIEGDTMLCIGDSFNLNGAGDGTLLWSPTSSLSCATCGNTIAKPTTNTTYVLVVTGFNQCTAKDSLAVAVRPLPTVNALESTLICGGENVTLTTQASPDAVSYTWTPAIGLDDPTKLSPVAGPTTTTAYQVTAYNQYGCTAKDSLTITVNNHLTVTVSNDQEICYGQSLTLVASAPTINGISPVFDWSPSDAVTDVHNYAQSITPLTSLTYTVIVTEGTCAADTQQIRVTVNPLPTVTLGSNQVVFPMEEIHLHAGTTGNIASYTWSPADACETCSTLNLIAHHSMEYNITVTDDKGCVATDNVKIKVISSCEEDVYMPNTFTPNGDGVNDMFLVRGSSITALKSFRIFDRWGNLVFETTDINQGWNGLYNGMPSSIGVYVYYVQGICRNGGGFTKTGNVTLMR